MMASTADRRARPPGTAGKGSLRAARSRRSPGAFFGVRKRARLRGRRRQAEPGARDRRRPRRRRGVRRRPGRCSSSWVVAERRAGHETSRSNRSQESSQHVSSNAPTAPRRTTSCRRHRAIWPIGRRSACCWSIFGAGAVGQRRTAGAAWSLLAGIRRAGLHAVRLVPHRRSARAKAATTTSSVDVSLPLEHELVHLLGGDVLRRLLRRAVLCARRSRCRGSATSTTSVPVAGLRRGQPGRQHRSPAGIVEPFQTMGPWPLPTINTALLLTSGVTLTIAHHALRAGHRAQDDLLDVAHRAAGRHLPGRAGLRVHARLSAT